MGRAEFAGPLQGLFSRAPFWADVPFDASSSTCSGDNANCDAFEWDFGDGHTDEGLNVVHTYATGGTKTVTLTVHEYGVGEATKTKEVKVYVADLPPVIGSTCNWDANTWTMQVVDSSTDDNGIVQMMVTWGDGSLTFVDTTAPLGPANHTYLGPGFFTVTHKVTDTVGQTAQNICLANPAYFTIGGTTRNNLLAPLSGVKLVFVRAATVVKTIYSNSVGVCSATNLKPGAYAFQVEAAAADSFARRRASCCSRSGASAGPVCRAASSACSSTPPSTPSATPARRSSPRERSALSAAGSGSRH